MNKQLLNIYKIKSDGIKPGKEYTLYFLYCSDCKEYKNIFSSAPIGPGGTLSCPICKIRKENGPGLESSYGSVHCKMFKVKLPEEVKIE